MTDSKKISDSVAKDNLEGLGLTKKEKLPSYEPYVPYERKPPPRSSKSTYEPIRKEEYPDIPDFLKRGEKEKEVEKVELQEPVKVGILEYEEAYLLPEETVRGISNDVMKAISDSLDDNCIVWTGASAIGMREKVNSIIEESLYYKDRISLPIRVDKSDKV